MSGKNLQYLGTSGWAGALLGVLLLVTGCGFKVAGPGETISVPTLTSEDLSGPCMFDLNMPDQPLKSLDNPPPLGTPAPKQVAALVIYERSDSGTLFDDPAIQSMAATLHMVTVYAHQCNSKVSGDLQPDAAKGPGRTLFAALTQYSIDSKHAEIANIPVVMVGFSAAGVLTTTIVNEHPDRILGFIPFASGSAYLDLDTVPVSAAAAKVPAMVLANAYDPSSGVQRSLRYYNRGYSQGAPWTFGSQNHTGHCCVTSLRDVMVPWVTALVTPLETGATIPTGGPASAGSVNWTRGSPGSQEVRFICYTDGFYDSYGEANCWTPSATLLPDTSGGPQTGWLPNAASAQAWLKWVLSPGTN